MDARSLALKNIGKNMRKWLAFAPVPAARRAVFG